VVIDDQDANALATLFGRLSGGRTLCEFSLNCGTCLLFASIVRFNVIV
jgi:hypothetical protein